MEPGPVPPQTGVKFYHRRPLGRVPSKTKWGIGLSLEPEPGVHSREPSLVLDLKTRIPFPSQGRNGVESLPCSYTTDPLPAGEDHRPTPGVLGLY